MVPSVVFRYISGYVLQRTCTNDSSAAVTVDQCEKIGNSSRAFFLYQNRCCLFTPNTSVPSDDRRFDQMSCGCQTDSCNGNVPYPMMPVTTPATNNNNNVAPCCQSLLGLMLSCTAAALGFFNFGP